MYIAKYFTQCAIGNTPEQALEKLGKQYHYAITNTQQKHIRVYKTQGTPKKVTMKITLVD